MVDSSKRRSLMTLGGVLSLPLVPALVSASDATIKSNTPTSALQATTQLGSSSDTELNISVLLDGTPVMKVTNTTNKLSILRRIKPGIVNANGKNYNLNQSLLSSAYAIGAGKTRLIPIGEAKHEVPVAELTGQHSHKQLRIATVTSIGKRGQVLNSTTAFFA